MNERIEELHSRREFLKLCSSGLAGIAVVGFIAPVINSCSSSPTGPGSQVAPFNISVDVSSLTQNNQALRTLTPDGNSLLIVRESATSFITLLLICPHASCGGTSMVQSSNSIICTCHGSMFTLTGQVVQGPAQTNLTAYSTAFNAANKTVTIHN
jgi:cytochrome b6-f complex iron-sulfur subunit